ncbi:hypothetical protein OG563_09480 [Nocardia vinacea]|uniref:Uncharacterized protein n=1 Tax=Nocardia vinacea TaxID=96468 RepID=A0ABZ1Z1W9_9NOCA|nr:hypothetical protein [Nocardia vinacea]
MTATIPARDAGPELYGDYCATCTRSGCTRMDSVCEPVMSEWSGGQSMVVATYACVNGHVWTCSWSPDYPFDLEEMEA